MPLSDAVEEAARLVAGGMRPTDAAKQVSARTRFRKSEIYAALTAKESGE